MKHTWRTRCVVGTALAGLAATATAASPALGASSDPTAITSYSITKGAYTTNNSANNKRADVSCPAGTVVLGGGGEIDGAFGRVGLRSVEPYLGWDGRYHVSVTAAEIPRNTLQAWKVRAIAACGKRPAGYSITRWKHSVSDSSTVFKTADAPCPAGRKPIGYGARVTGGSGNVSLRTMNVTGGTRTVRVSASEAAEDATSRWYVSGLAVCASAGQVEKLGHWSTSGSANVLCPVNQKALGAGMSLAANPSTRRNLLVRAVHPYRPSTFPFTRVGSLVRVSEDWNGTSGAWKVHARVICAP